MFQQSPILVACSVDQRYAPGLAVMVRSLLDAHRGKRKIELYVLETDLSDIIKKRLLSSWNDPRLKVTFLRPDTKPLEGLTCFGGVHTAMYFYLLLPTLLLDCKKILKLDADMLILGDIEELWNTDLGEHPTAAVQELRAPLLSSEWALPNWRELGLCPDAKYYNAGLQLMNLEIWRREKIADAIIAHTKKYEKIIRYWDQDGVNAVLADRWLELDPVWNVEAEALMLTGWKPEEPERMQRLIEGAKIVHFVVKKPWQKDCPHPQTKKFLEVLLRTGWHDLADGLLHKVPLHWFSHHVPQWEKLLAPYKNKPDIHMLEIGSWVGNSACWLLQHILTHPSSSLTCIDLFERDLAFEEQAAREGLGAARLDPSFNIEERFDANIQAIGAKNRLVKIKGDSEEKVRTLPLQRYDCIYVDGSHIARDVCLDAVHSWPCLKEGGLLIFDDYQLRMYAKRVHNPCAGIELFFALMKGQYDLIDAGWQIVIRKRPTNRRHPQLRAGPLQNPVKNAKKGSLLHVKIRRKILRGLLSI